MAAKKKAEVAPEPQSPAVALDGTVTVRALKSFALFSGAASRAVAAGDRLTLPAAQAAGLVNGGLADYAV